MARQGRGAPCRLVDLGQPATRGRRGGHVAEGQRQAARDRGEEVVEVVRDAPRESSHRLHLLRLPQAGLERQALRLRATTVAHVPDDALVGPVRHPPRVHLDRQLGPVLPGEGPFHHLGLVAGEGLVREGDKDAIGEREQDLERLAQELLARVARQLGRAAVRLGDPLCRAHDDRVGRQLHKAAAAHLGGAQGGLLALEALDAPAEPPRHDADADARHAQDQHRVDDVADDIARPCRPGEEAVRLGHEHSGGGGERDRRRDGQRAAVEQDPAEDQRGRQDEDGRVAKTSTGGDREAGGEDGKGQGQDLGREPRTPAVVDPQGAGRGHDPGEQDREGPGVGGEAEEGRPDDRDEEGDDHRASDEADAAGQPGGFRVRGGEERKLGVGQA